MRKGLVVFLLVGFLVFSAASRAAARPGWTRVKPHFETRDGRSVAVAVGRGRGENLALARAQAEDDARAGLLRLLQKKGPREPADGSVRGAKVVEFFETGRGVVYARLEISAP